MEPNLIPLEIEVKHSNLISVLDKLSNAGKWVSASWLKAKELFLIAHQMLHMEKEELEELFQQMRLLSLMLK
jgi:hypothetical protein